MLLIAHPFEARELGSKLKKTLNILANISMDSACDVQFLLLHNNSQVEDLYFTTIPRLKISTPQQSPG